MNPTGLSVSHLEFRWNIIMYDLSKKMTSILFDINELLKSSELSDEEATRIAALTLKVESMQVAQTIEAKDIINEMIDSQEEDDEEP